MRVFGTNRQSAALVLREGPTPAAVTAPPRD